MSLVAGRFQGSAREWDDFALAQSGFTHFHRHGWQGVIESVFGHECLYLAARTREGQLAGILPLVRVRSLLFGHFLVSMPFLNYGGPLGSSAAIEALAALAASEAERSRAALAELRSRVPLPIGLPVSHRKITVTLGLPTSVDALHKGFEAKLRSQVRRPLKEGVSVRFGGDQVDGFFDVFSRHMRDLGTPTLPKRFFEAIAQHFPEDAWFGTAWLAGRPVACGAGFRWGGEFEMTWASSLRQHSRIAPNMLLYAAFMERSIAEGLRVFNFGRCTAGSGTHRFKRQWGGVDEPLWWYQWTPDGRREPATPSPEQAKYRWAPALWRQLPLGLSRWIGPRIVRMIP